MLTNQLDQLRKMSVVVSDSSDFDAVKIYTPIDATTNPTLVLQAAQKPEYRFVIERAISESALGSTPEHRRALLIDNLFVLFGVELLKIIPGRVSTEVEASLSFDAKASIERAVQIITLYERYGIPKERVLIKLASTIEGIRAAQVLEMVGIHCNMTLIFSLIQAAACAEANATLASPFVGRILDWHKKQNPSAVFTPATDPGVRLVTTIYQYFKKFGYKTSIMGASFRNKEQIVALAGCDFLTISPKFLDELSGSTDRLEKMLSPEMAAAADIQKAPVLEPSFRFLLNQDQMATEKLSEGIRIFTQDANKLVEYVSTEFGWSPNF
jgi:transaldolase